MGPEADLEALAKTIALAALAAVVPLVWMMPWLRNTAMGTEGRGAELRYPEPGRRSDGILGISSGVSCCCCCCCCLPLSASSAEEED